MEKYALRFIRLFVSFDRQDAPDIVIVNAPAGKENDESPAL
jgi:hypothetical protein